MRLHVGRVVGEDVQVDVAAGAHVPRRHRADEARREGGERLHGLEGHYPHREEAPRASAPLDLDDELQERVFDLAVGREILRAIPQRLRVDLPEEALCGEALRSEVLLHLLAVHDLRCELGDGGAQPAVPLPAHGA
jgi:hypothetical protein